ncbi:MAG: hypothetical protein ABJB16_01775 [Saprospiraceae bacterium]
MPGQIELGIEKMNHGNWLKVTIPYKTNIAMTATLLSIKGELLKTVRLASGNNLIDIESMTDQSVRIRIDTPYEILSRELYLK